MVNGNHAPESDEWRDLANLREAKVEELTRENREMRDQLQEAQLQVMPCALVVESGRMLSAFDSLKHPRKNLSPSPHITRSF